MKRGTKRWWKRKREVKAKPEKLRNVHRVTVIRDDSLDITAQESSANSVEVFQEATLYTTMFACWTPHYDLRLDTTDSSLPSLTYHAHVTNHTYETWSRPAITLSTSKAAFGDLKDKIPQMEGWRVTLEHYACRERGERPIQPCRTEGQEGGEAKGIWYWYCQRARRAACNDVHDRWRVKIKRQAECSRSCTYGLSVILVR